ncbi:MAG: tetratricopeptide repeat protein [Bacteroidales bacterium]|nr:tetratricopeptide repeat protein [Bacteroidales bacterium]
MTTASLNCRYNLIILIIFIFSGSCSTRNGTTREETYNKTFSLADSLSHFNPSRADSLYRSILSDSNDLVPVYRTKALIGLSEIYITRGVTDTAEALLRNAHFIAGKTNDTVMLMNVILAFGNLKLDQGDNEKALGYYERGLTLARTVCDTVFQNRFLLNLGNLQLSGGNFPAAVKTFTQGILLAREKKDEITLSVALDNLGLTLSRTGETEEALKNIKESLEIKKRLNLKREYAQGLQNMGIIYRKAGNNDLALQRYREAIVILTDLHDSLNLVRVKYNAAIILKNQKKYNEAETELYRIITFCRQHRIYDGIGLSWSALASIYSQTGRGTEGIRAIDSAIATAVMTRNFAYLPLHLDSKHEILTSLGLYKEAYQALIQSRKMSDSLFSLEKQKEITSILAKSDAIQKEAENKVLKKDLEVKNFRLLLLWVGFGAFLIIFVTIVILLRTRQKQLRQEMKLAAEQSKLEQQERKNKEVELEKVKVEKLLQDEELKTIQLEARLNEDKIEQLELQRQLQEQKLVYDTLVQADLAQINRSVSEKLSPFTLKLSRKKDQDDFSHTLHDLSREASRDPMAEFEILFRQIHGSFYEKLLQLCPSLTKSELNICALMRLNLSSKDISRLTNLSLATIETTRHHIRKKLLLGTGDNLTTFMIGL